MSQISYDGAGELHITDIDEARTLDKSNIDRVITTCQDSIEDNVSNEMEYTHYNMSDGPDNKYGGRSDYDIFADAAQELYQALSTDETVLIHCHMGQSRSVSVSVAALGQLLGKTRHEAWDIVRRYRPQAHPDRLLMEHADKYIDNHTDVGSGPPFTGIVVDEEDQE